MTTVDIVWMPYAGAEFLHCELGVDRLHAVCPWPWVAGQSMPLRKFAFLSPAFSRPRFFTVVIVSIRQHELAESYVHRLGCDLAATARKKSRTEVTSNTLTVRSGRDTAHILFRSSFVQDGIPLPRLDFVGC